MFETTFSDGTTITPYSATAYAEGFCEGENASSEDQLRAWAYLIKSGMCWTLQGFFGRNASQLIANGVITRDGVINWDQLDDLE